jgi:hypothetical protein
VQTELLSTIALSILFTSSPVKAAQFIIVDVPFPNVCQQASKINAAGDIVGVRASRATDTCFAAGPSHLLTRRELPSRK